MTASKPFLRSIAGAEPTVPCSSTMLQLPLLACASQAPASLPSRLKSAEMRVTNSDLSATSTSRSARNTGNAGLLGLFEHLIPAGDDDRRDDDRVDLLGDERANRLQLLFFLALRVGEFEVDAFLLRLFLHVLGEGRTPVAFVAHLREADRDGERRRSRQKSASRRPRRRPAISKAASFPPMLSKTWSVSCSKQALRLERRHPISHTILSYAVTVNCHRRRRRNSRLDHSSKRG